MLLTAHAAAAPGGLAYNPVTKFLYVTNSLGDTVYVVNTPANTVINSIIVGIIPTSIVINPQNTLAYVADSGDGTISVISLASGTVVDTITGANSPNIIAFNPSGSIAYVTESANDVISVINVSSNTITNSIQLPYSCSGQILNGVAFTPDGTNALVSSGCSGGSGSANVEVINVSTNTIIATIGLSTNYNPQEIAVNPAGGFAYVSAGYESSFGILNLVTDTLSSSTGTGPWPSDIAFNQQGTLAYQLVGSSSGTISVINPAGNTVINTIDVGNEEEGNPAPGGLAFSASGTTAWITNFGSGTVSVINVPSNTVINTITMGLPNPAVSFSLTNNSITSGQTITFLTEITGGTGPFDVELFNTTIGSNAITNVVIDSSGVVNTIQIQSDATGTFSYNELITDTGRDYAFNSLTINLIVSPQTPSPGVGGGPAAKTYPYTITDNLPKVVSQSGVLTIYLSDGNVTYSQNQLPYSVAMSAQSMQISFACSVKIGTKSYSFVPTSQLQECNVPISVGSGTTNTTYSIMQNTTTNSSTITTTSSTSTSSTTMNTTSATTTEDTSVPPSQNNAGNGGSSGSGGQSVSNSSQSTNSSQTNLTSNGQQSEESIQEYKANKSATDRKSAQTIALVSVTVAVAAAGGSRRSNKGSKSHK